MRPRDYAVPLALLTAAAAFVGYQALDVQQSAPQRAHPVAAIAPQGDTAQRPPPASSPAAAVSTRGTGEITVTASSERAPRFDTASVRSLLRENIKGTYLDQMLKQEDNFLIRWPERRMSMRVWMERNSPVPNWNPQYSLVVEKAFAEWQQAGFPLRFDMIIEPRDVDIRIEWIEKFPPDQGQSIGVAKKVRDQHGWLVESEITIATHDTRGQPLPPALIAGIARHEIGHALGLGHSNNPGDVMYPESETSIISEADRRTLRLLYLLPPGRIP